MSVNNKKRKDQDATPLKIGASKQGKNSENITSPPVTTVGSGADEMDINDLEFEDPYGDDYEDEEIVDEEELDDEEAEADKIMPVEGEEEEKLAKQVWRPDLNNVAEGEELDYDPSAYIMYHSFCTEWPALSFDFIRDNLGDNRQRFPLTMTMVVGSQADRAENNKITLLQLTDLHKTHVAADSDDEEEDDEDLDEDPSIEHVDIPHFGGVNRIRHMPQSGGLVASMADTGKTHIFDLRPIVQSFQSHGPRNLFSAAQLQPIFTHSGHRAEGYAIDWSPVVAGKLATGDCQGAVHIWTPANASGSSWQVDIMKAGHESSVEDIQWSPSEGTVFASCSADRSIKIWDIRDKNKAQISWAAHEADVNVISWNRSVGYLLASGSDDGSFKVWDLRSIATSKKPLAYFAHHKAAITSIEWAPHDESVLALSSADNQVTVWDLSVEADDAQKASSEGQQNDFPAQLLFMHLGQKNIKEIHFHPQIPGVIASTCEDSFNLFKPAISVAAS